MQHFDLDITEANLIAMILQEDMTLGGLAKILPDLVFADGDQVLEGGRAALVFQYFYPVEIMYDMVVGIDDDATRVPLTDGPKDAFWLIGGDEVIEAGEGAVAVASQLGVGMKAVVEQLIFEADGGTRVLLFGSEGDEIFDAAVRAGS